MKSAIRDVVAAAAVLGVVLASSFAVGAAGPASASGAVTPPDVALGTLHTCAVTSDGDVKCWGGNAEGQLGDGNLGTDSDTPIAVDLGNGITATSIAAGTNHACAITATGDVMCWGNNSDGQLGDGNQSTDTDTPVEVDLGGSTTATAIAAGNVHTCVITGTNGVMCWGANSDGQLGTGNNDKSLTPVGVSLGVDVTATAIAAGREHTCVITNSDTVKCWGSDDYGELGNGAGGSSNAPVDVDLGGVTTATSIAAGRDHTCASTDTGGVKCWGIDNYGQLGNGSTDTDFDDPTDVSLAPGVSMKHVVAGDYHTSAITSTDSLKCWGNNFSGQIGNGDSPTKTETPADVSLGADATLVAGGANHTCAITSVASLECWGLNFSGQLGKGDSGAGTNSDVPVTVGIVLGTTTPLKCAGLLATEVGTVGDDVLNGTSGDDVIVSLGGNDIINAKGGNDTICTGGGDDTVNGGFGADAINGGNGDDTLNGGPGNDTINGQGGTDTIDGDGGRDTLNGNNGGDTIRGGPGNDDALGGGGADKMHGNGGGDGVSGGAGNDTVNGNKGNDTLNGNDGRDRLNGHGGNDALDGGKGPDECHGGPGNNDTAIRCPIQIAIP